MTSKEELQLTPAGTVKFCATFVVILVCWVGCLGGIGHQQVKPQSLSTPIVPMLRSISPCLSNGDLPRFEDYKVPLYRGAIKMPKWIHRIDDDEWRDELDKLVEPPEINFAGSYFIAVHSCGTECRFYTLTNLSSGRDLEELDIFATGDPAPRTRDGHEYLTELISRRNSSMLVAHYYVQLAPTKEECRERVFLFEGEKLKPITGTLRGCRKI